MHYASAEQGGAHYSRFHKIFLTSCQMFRSHACGQTCLIFPRLRLMPDQSRVAEKHKHRGDATEGNQIRK